MMQAENSAVAGMKMKEVATTVMLTVEAPTTMTEEDKDITKTTTVAEEAGQDTMTSTIPETVDDTRMIAITEAERIMELTATQVENKKDMIVTKETQPTAEDPVTVAHKEVVRTAPMQAVIGIPEAVATERLMATPGVAPATRRIMLTMSGMKKATANGHNTTRWAKMMAVVKRQPLKAGQQVKRMKDCASFLRINSRICTGLKKH
jgi:methionine-rich copper-binding protein CopC